MTSLTNQLPEYTYPDLLTTTNSGQGLTTVLKNLQDGIGNNSTVQIATNAINFNRTGGNSFQLDGTAITPLGVNINSVCNPNAIMPGNGGMTVPIGTTAERTSPAINGEIRYNTDTTLFECYQNGSWQNMIPSFTSISGTAGQIVVTGTTTKVISLANHITNVKSITLENIQLNVATNTISSLADFELFATTDLTITGTNVLLSSDTGLRFLDADGSNYIALKAPATVSSNATFTLPPEDGDAGFYLATDGSGNLDFLEPSALFANFITVSHGLSVGQIVRIDSIGDVVKAQANSAANAEVVAIVTKIIDADEIEIIFNGKVNGLSGLVAGTTYFLSPTVAGAYTATIPSIAGQVVKPLFVAYSATGLIWLNQRGNVL